MAGPPAFAKGRLRLASGGPLARARGRPWRGNRDSVWHLASIPQGFRKLRSLTAVAALSSPDHLGVTALTRPDPRLSGSRSPRDPIALGPDCPGTRSSVP